jgi:hypothetical protein
MNPVDWPELHEAADAARVGDQDHLRRLIDWPLSGLPTMLAAVSAVDKSFRAAVVASGLSELDGAADNPRATKRILPAIVARLAQATVVYRANPDQRASFLAALGRGDHAPDGLTLAQLDRLASLAARAESVSDTYVLSAPLGETVVGRVPISGRLVFVLSSLSTP